MQTTTVILALAALLMVVATWVIYLSSIPRGKVPVTIWSSALPQMLGMLLACAALIISYRESGRVGMAVLIPALFALMAGLSFLYLLSLRKTPLGNLTVAVGQKLLPFETTSSDGTLFHSDAFAGKRILLKFFRGGW